MNKILAILLISFSLSAIAESSNPSEILDSYYLKYDFWKTQQFMEIKRAEELYEKEHGEDESKYKTGCTRMFICNA